MEIKNRLFPYPVLNDETDDYVNSSFDITYSVKEELSNFIFTFTATISNNEELEWLVRDGIAEKVIHVECSSTAYRKVFKFIGEKISFKIPKSKINNEVYFLGMILANRDIKNFTSKSLNNDYGNEPLNFKKGAVLAYKNLPKMVISKNYEELKGDTSFFSIIKRNNVGDTNEQPIIYDLYSPKIKIIVDESLYNEYIKYHNNDLMKPIIMSLLILPALSYTVEIIRDNGYEPFVSLFWYQKISKSCALQGKNFVNDIINSEKSCMEVAQDLLQYPIVKAFESLSKVIEG